MATVTIVEDFDPASTSRPTYRDSASPSPEAERPTETKRPKVPLMEPSSARAQKALKRKKEKAKEKEEKQRSNSMETKSERKKGKIMEARKRAKKAGIALERDGKRRGKSAGKGKRR